MTDGKEIDPATRLRYLERTLTEQDEALERIMRHAMHAGALDVTSARNALADIYAIAKECRGVED